MRYKQRPMLSLLQYRTWSEAGGPSLPLPFVTAVEILAIAIRNQENIKGLTIDGLETKLLQFADDTTAVLSDLDSARALFGLLERFEKASGLKLNVTKTEVGSIYSYLVWTLLFFLLLLEGKEV